MINYKIHFIRHGATQGNLDGKYIGVTDIPMCVDGEEELKALVKCGEYPTVQKVYTSPLLRCKQTAQIIYPENFVVEAEDLTEYNFGEFENKSMQELKSNEHYKKWASSFMEEAPEGGEVKADFDARIERGFEAILLDMMKNKITSAAIITHGGVIMALLAKFGLPKREPLRWTVANGKGYTALANAQLWSRDRMFEVFNTIPYINEESSDYKDYSLIEISKEEDETE